MHSGNWLLRAGVGLILSAHWLSGLATTTTTRPGPAASLELLTPAHVQRAAIGRGQLPPLPASRTHLFHDYDAPPARSLAGGCDHSSFANANGTALIAAIKAVDSGCINELFSLSGATAAAVFNETKMIRVAQAIQTDAGAYPGNNTGKMLQLVLFMRAGYYVQFYDPAVGNYGSALTAAIRPALAAFVNNSHFTDISDGHGEVLTEFVTLIDSSGENAQQLATVRGILERYGPDHHGLWYMRSAVNSVFTVLFRGHYNDDFAALMPGQGSALAATLKDFILDNRTADVGSEREYLLQNAGGELARLLQYPDSLHSALHPGIKAVLDSFGLTGPGAGIYVRLASVADYYDHEHCSYFGLCNFATDLEAQVLPAAHARNCSSTLRIRSQALTPPQLDLVCSIVAGEESYFHNQAQTGLIPVANDFNSRLEMVIFHSSTDYETYSGVIFGNDTNNGGIYLEGNPADPANQARFLAYEAEWLRPVFEVWNLTHEYIHYLDGRFNWFGGFGGMPLDAPYSAVWYIEGFAEYLSYGYRNLVYTRAVTEAANPDRFTLSQLFDNEYGTDYARTYQWGYLATRFMFERQRALITSLYAVTRPGNYDPGYRIWLDAIRGQFNAEFRSWLQCFAQNNGNTSSCNGASDAVFSSGFEP